MEYHPPKFPTSCADFTANKGYLGRDALRKKKKRRSILLIRVASYVLNLKKSTKSKCDLVNAFSLWKKFVSSMRPLQLQSYQSPPRLMAPKPPLKKIPVIDRLEVYTPPMSPDNGMSQYASATNLIELDENEGENDMHDDKGEDGMIDAKAEQLIAEFYQQMSLHHEAYQSK